MRTTPSRFVPMAFGACLLGGVSAPAALAAPPVATAPAFSGAPVSADKAAANKAELVTRVRAYSSDSPWPSRVVSELMTFKLSEEGWKLLLSPAGVKAVFGAARDVNDYAQRIGLGDLEKVESASNAREANQADVGALLATYKPVISLTLEATQPTISPTSASLILRAFSTVAYHMDRGAWKPAGGKALIALTLSPVAKDVTVTMNREKTNFAIVAPSQAEMAGWSVKIEKGLDRGK